MASTYTGLGVQLMTTGEKAGTWGTLTNTNWNIMEQISGGYTAQALSSTPTTLSVSDGTAGATLAHRIIEFTGTIGENFVVTIPLDVQTFYIIKNGTSGAYTVQFKYVSGSGSSVTWSTTDKGTKLIYAAADDATNPNIVDTGFLSNVVDDTSPQLGGDLDVNSNDLVSTSNGNIDIVPNGTGVARAKDGGGTTAAVKIAGTETIWVPAQAMFGTTTNGADAQAVETQATRPELKVLDFDASTNEYAQFSVAMPKSWNLGTITFQAFWSPGDTDTGNALIGLQGVGVANDDTSDIAFGTAVDVTDAGGGAVEDVLVSPVSGAVTIAGTPADDDYTYFQVYRNATDGSDTFTGDVRLLGIKLFFTTDLANDA